VVNGDEKDEHGEHAPVAKSTRLKEDWWRYAMVVYFVVWSSFSL
jgi:hypothetical protein